MLGLNLRVRGVVPSITSISGSNKLHISIAAAIGTGRASGSPLAVGRAAALHWLLYVRGEQEVLHWLL